MRILIFLLVGLPGFLVQAQDGKRLLREVKKIIKYDTEITHKEVPQFLIGVIDNDSTYVLPFAKKSKRKDTERIKRDDVFYIGGLSKTFTAALISHKIREGRFSYEDRISQFLPKTCRNPYTDSLTIQDLLSHTTALPKVPDNLGKHQENFKDPYGSYTKEDLCTFLSAFEPGHLQKKEFKYSHTNYAVLELLLEKIEERPFEDLMSEFLTSLNLESTKVYNDNSLVSDGRERSGKASQLQHFPSFAGSEGLVSSMNDLLRFAAFQIRDSLFNSDHEINRPTSYHDEIFMGNAWHIFNYERYPIYTHSGRTGGHYAYIGFIKETQTAVVILANSATGTEDLGMQILRLINYNWKRKPNEIAHGKENEP